MDKSTHQTIDEKPGLEGPDYVALVIEWDEQADSLEPEPAALPKRSRRNLGTFAAIAGVLGVAVAAFLGVRHFRSA